MGVKFVTPKSGDAVAVVARSVEAREEDEAGTEDEAENGAGNGAVGATDGDESSDLGTDATIEGDGTSESPDSTVEHGPDTDGESEG
jgi:DNA gyrase subunit A